MRKEKELRVVTKRGEFERVVAGESDEELVKVLRQVQPYMSAHTKRVFVVFLSAEIVGSPSLGAILKVPLIPPISSFIK